MPFAASLTGVAHWFCQLWAESLGKKIGLDGVCRSHTYAGRGSH